MDEEDGGNNGSVLSNVDSSDRLNFPLHIFIMGG
jgi:hypothetical protein